MDTNTVAIITAVCRLVITILAIVGAAWKIMQAMITMERQLRSEIHQLRSEMMVLCVPRGVPQSLATRKPPKQSEGENKEQDRVEEGN